MSSSALMDWYNEQQEKYHNYSGNVKKGIKAGRIFSQNDLESARFDILANEAQWQHEEDMYNKYESPSAMVAQYQEAGLNPALMYQQGASPASVDTGGTEMSADSTTGSAAFEPLQIISSLIGMVSQGANVGSLIGDTVSKIKQRNVDNKVAQQNADTEAFKAETDRLRLGNEQVGTEARAAADRALATLYGEQAKIPEAQRNLLSAQTSKAWQEISNLETSRQKAIFDCYIEAYELACHEKQVEVNDAAVKLARDKWEQGEKQVAIAEAQLLGQKTKYYEQKQRNEEALTDYEGERTTAYVDFTNTQESYFNKLIQKTQNDIEIDSANWLLKDVVFGTYDRIVSTPGTIVGSAIGTAHERSSHGGTSHPNSGNGSVPDTWTYLYTHGNVSCYRDGAGHLHYKDLKTGKIFN